MSFPLTKRKIFRWEQKKHSKTASERCDFLPAIKLEFAIKESDVTHSLCSVLDVNI